MKKIYLAAPFFTPLQLASVMCVEDFVAKALAGRAELFSPRSEGILKDMVQETRAARMQAIFASNVKHIEEADLVLALIGEPDMGTTWELGYAYALHCLYHQPPKPEQPAIITVGRDDKPINVMLRNCVDKHCNNWDEMFLALSEWINGLPFSGADERDNNVT